MKKYLITASLFILFFTALRAQTITGDWNGTLAVMGHKLRLVFHIKTQNDSLIATMDSPDQGAAGIPTSLLTFQYPDLHIEVGNGMIVYKGSMATPDSISGTFTQSGMTFDLPLKRGNVETRRPQEVQPPFPYKSEEITFANPKAGITLAGTLTVPEKGSKFPAVVLISGSGPQDRNETIMGHKPFLVIADYLTRQGIAVLRFDDRGTGSSQGNFDGATSADFATDVEAAVAYLRGRKEINADQIGLIGHSEGGIIAPMVAAQDKRIAFVVMLAGTGFDGAEILVMQNEAIGRASGLTEKDLENAARVNRILYKEVASGPIDSVHLEKTFISLKPLLSEKMSDEEIREFTDKSIRQLNTPWILYFLKNNPVNYLEKVKCPVLAVGGSKDLQVPARRNLDAIEKALRKGGNKRVTTREFTGLNHLFQQAVTGLPDEYGSIEQTFSPEVLDYVGKWIGDVVK